MSKYSVVIPCYKSGTTIEQVVKTTIEELKNLGETDVDFILVNDCSPDEGKTSTVLRKLAEEIDCVTVIELAKNSGQHNAVMAGLNYASGEYIIAMDDDMQTHPSQIKYLLDEMKKGYDVVYGYYPEKKHSLFRNFGSYINYLSGRILLGKPKEIKTSSFWVMKRFVRTSIIEYKNSYAYLQGLILRTTRNIGCVPVKHFERAQGTSTYTLKALFRLWSSIIGFSLTPLRMCTYCGYFFAVVGVFAAIGIVIAKILNPAMAMGWPSLMSAISFFFGLSFLFMGLIGEYVGRIFLGLNNEPQYVVKEIVSKNKER